MNTIILDILIGFAGAIAKMIVEDGGLVMPNLKEGKIYFGGIGGIIVGGMAGVIANHDGITTFLAGYAGTSLITYLVANNTNNTTTICTTIEQQIRDASKSAGIDPDLAVRIAKCESSLNPAAVNVNSDGSMDRGLFQINNKAHPEISDLQAFNTNDSIQFFIKAFKEGHISWWNSSKTCWDLTQ